MNQHNKVIDNVFYNDRTEYYTDSEGVYHERETYDNSLGMDRTVVLASMIEKEAATREDYGRVSAVFHNRLDAGWKLESDPTATYLSGQNKLVAETTSKNSRCTRSSI